MATKGSNLSKYQSTICSLLDLSSLAISTSVIVPTSYTNNALGLAWVEQVFNKHSKEKARRRWQLLIIHGYGSHLTMDLSISAITTGSSWLYFHLMLLIACSHLMW
jgi:hypothetical protein